MEEIDGRVRGLAEFGPNLVEETREYIPLNIKTIVEFAPLDQMATTKIGPERAV
jgi:hypothetical protein